MEKDYKTIAVDFDGTLCFSNWPELGAPNKALIAYLQEWRKMVISSFSGPAAPELRCQMLSNGVITTDWNSMLSMTIS